MAFRINQNRRITQNPTESHRIQRNPTESNGIKWNPIESTESHRIHGIPWNHAESLMIRNLVQKIGPWRIPRTQHTSSGRCRSRPGGGGRTPCRSERLPLGRELGVPNLKLKENPCQPKSPSCPYNNIVLPPSPLLTEPSPWPYAQLTTRE